MSRGWRDDTGASLLPALALTTFLGLVIGALLSYTSASVRATKAADTRAGRTYDADGALKTAVNQVRNSTFNNEPGGACPDLTVPPPDGGTSLRVTCTGAAKTGAAGELVPITAANRPAQAVLTLTGNSGEPGVAQSAGGSLRVQGKVFSTGPVTAGSGTVESTNAVVTARGACAGAVVSRNAAGATVPNACSAAASAIPADPDYPQPTAGLTYRPLPACDSTSTVEFLPGYYDDAVGLSAMMAGTGACAGKTFLFRAAAGGGVYYFDFRNGEGDALPAGSRVWTINDRNARVVGGTPLGWTPDAGTPALPGACVSPLRSTTGSGVRFVFGGDSRLLVRAGAVELCGQYSASAPPIVLQGAKTGADVTGGPATLVTNGGGTNPTNGPAFANPARITALDGNPATAVVDSTLVLGGVTASVVVEGFAPPGTIPAGSLLTSAKLLVTHRDNNANAFSRLRLLQVSAAPLRDGAAALADVPQPTIYQDGPTGTAFHTDTLDITDSLGDEVHTYGFTGLRVRYDAGAGFLSRVTANLDSIQLVLAWKPPAVRGQQTAVNGTANCIARYPAGCDLLETEPTATGLWLQGTLYAPYGVVDLKPATATSVAIRSGLVTRSLLTQVPVGAADAAPLVEIPNDSTGAVPLEVYFRAYAGTTVLATARVRFAATDPTATPVAGRRAVTVLSWTIRRR